MASTSEHEHLTTQPTTDFIYSPQDSIISPIVYLVAFNVLRCLSVLVSIFGIISNTFNVIIGKQLIVSDSLAPTIVLLALVDGIVCVMHLLKACLFRDLYSFVFDVDDFLARKELFENIINFFFHVSILIVLNVCVRVCLGVISSIRIDKVFIRKRLRASNLLIIVFTTVCFVAVWIINEMGMKNYDPYLNQTSLNTQFAAEYHAATLFLFAVGKILVPAFALIVSLWSIVILSLVFKRSAKLRQKHTIPSLEPSDLAKLDEKSNKRSLCTQERGHKPSVRANVLSNSYVKMAKMVTMLAVMCHVCTLPYCVPTIVALLNPDQIPMNIIQVMFILVATLSECVGLLNASVKIFCYRSVNAKFRQELSSLINSLTTGLKNKMCQN